MDYHNEHMQFCCEMCNVVNSRFSKNFWKTAKALKGLRISLERPYFPMLMPDYIIEGNTQAAAQGNSWQDGVNALVML